MNFSYIKEIFSSENCASFARWSTGVTVVAGTYSLVHLVRHNHALPDPTQLVALAAWMTAPYGISKMTAAFAKPKDDGPGGG